MNMSRLLMTFVAFGLVACGSRAATTTTATPETLQKLLDAAQSGDTIRLASGTYPAFRLRDKAWTPSVTVEAGTARMTSIDIRHVSGLTWRGGVFDSNNTERFGINAKSGERIVIENTRMSRYLRVGIGFGEITDSRLINNEFFDMGSDGIDVALSRRILIDRTSCHDFVPTPGAHPDCVQLWSRPVVAPTADITVSNTLSVGNNQGVTAFNHARDGVDDGGFDRITLINNVVRSMHYQGINLTDCRECIARDNRVDSIPNPINAKLRSWLRAPRSTMVEMCGNVISSFPNLPGQQRCAKKKG